MVRPYSANGYYGKEYKICRENFHGRIFRRPTTDGKAIFIDLIDVGCECVNGFGWLRV